MSASEDPFEYAYWEFDARRKGYGRWHETPWSERDAFKAIVAGMVSMRDDRLRELLETLEFYANPDTYMAISFDDDPPSGEFMDDFSECDWAAYNRPMPGRRARIALRIETHGEPPTNEDR